MKLILSNVLEPGEQYVDFEEGLQNPSSVNTQYARFLPFNHLS